MRHNGNVNAERNENSQTEQVFRTYTATLQKSILIGEPRLILDAIIHSKTFESAIANAILGREISQAEQECLKAFEIEQTPFPDHTNSQDEQTSFAEQVLQAKKRRKTSYDLEWVPPTSNIAERSFSQAKHILSPERKRLYPMHVEALMFLKANEKLWDAILVSKL